MKITKSKKTYLVVVCVISLMLIFFGFINSLVNAPSDNSLINNLNKNQEDFNKLITMCVEDKSMNTLTYAKLQGPVQDSVNDSERWNEYKTIFKKLNLAGMDCDGLSNQINFRSNQPIFGNSKNYVYTNNQVPLFADPNPIIVSSIDNYQKINKGNVVIRKIKDNWFLSYLDLKI